MNDDHAIYRKSARGTEALSQRDPSLTLKLRSLLIFVDGKRTVADLARLSGPGSQVLLQQLVDLGMVDAVPAGKSAVANGTASAAGRPTGPAPAIDPPTFSLKDAQRCAVRKLTDLLGPGADDLCMRIEATRTPQDFSAAVRRAEAALRDFNGPRAAAAFAQAMQAHQPA